MLSPRRRSPRPLLRVLLVLLPVLLLTTACSEEVMQEIIAALPTPTVTPPPTIPLAATTDDSPVQVFFTAPPCTDDPENRTPPPHLPVLLNDINNATDSVYVAMYEYELPAVGEALAAAHERGVDVQLALDEETGAESDDPNWGDMLGDLNIPISWETGTRFMHSKFFIIDNAIVWMGSWNATDNDTYRNNNNVLRLRVPPITENYNAEFGQMMLGFFGNDKTASTPNPIITLEDGTRIETHFAPVEPVEDFVVARIAGANERIAFMTFSYTEDLVGDAMRERAAAGVEVTGVFEGRNANGTGSEYAQLVDAGADVLTDGNGYTMHHKVIIIDRQTVITGSFNYTARAVDTNDENLLIIDNPAIATAFEEEFSRVYTLAADPSICD